MAAATALRCTRVVTAVALLIFIQRESYGHVNQEHSAADALCYT